MTDATASPEEARESARRALVSGLADDALAMSRGTLLDPVPIRSLAGEAAGWMVPVELQGALLGFAHLLPDGSFHRYAAFHAGDGSTDRCPRTRDWLDPAVLLGRAADLAGPDDSLDAPVLSYDGSPDRLAWAIRVTSPLGEQRVVFVAGEAAWVGRSAADSEEPSTG